MADILVQPHRISALQNDSFEDSCAKAPNHCGSLPTTEKLLRCYPEHLRQRLKQRICDP